MTDHESNHASGQQSLITQLNRLGTETPNPATSHLDQATSLEICTAINREDQTVPQLIAKILPTIAEAAEHFAATLRNGGRIFYIGAGTSGRLGVLDAAECPPTFGTDPREVVGIIAGGFATLVSSAEGVEDSQQDAVDHLQEQKLSAKDMVIGIAASTRTPYTLAGVAYADSLGCQTYLLLCNEPVAAIPHRTKTIVVPVGPEVITGSTRMKSGTAQKLVLNMISTTAMILNGKTYGNRMVDLVSRSAKLAARSRKMLMEMLGCTLDDADRMLARSEGSVKVALVMESRKVDRTQAITLLREAHGHLWKVLGPISK